MKRLLLEAGEHPVLAWPQIPESVARSSGMPWYSSGIWPQVGVGEPIKIPAQTLLLDRNVQFSRNEGVPGSSPGVGLGKWLEISHFLCSEGGSREPHVPNVSRDRRVVLRRDCVAGIARIARVILAWGRRETSG
jgi:hypothetical protein